MKLSILELRDMVADTVREVVGEAATRLPKEVPTKTPENEEEARERQVRGLKGYKHSKQNDFSSPLGPANIVKRQGASGMGGWTAESVSHVKRRIHELQVRRLVRMIVAEEVAQARRGRP